MPGTVALRTAVRAVILLVLLALPYPLVPAESQAADNAEPASRHRAVAPADLNHSIDEVIQQREYTWRFPRDRAELALRGRDVDLSFFERLGQSVEKAFKTVSRWVKDFLGWLKLNPKPRTASAGSGFDWGGALRIVLFILALALAGLIFYLLLRLWRERASGPVASTEALPAQPAPDLQDEQVGADQLPENEWIVLARDLLAQGEFRLALRAYYLASLAHLAERNLITIARFKSNRDYERELRRRGHALPDLVGLFSHNVTLFEKVWYGMRDISSEDVREFAADIERLKGGPAPRLT